MSENKKYGVYFHPDSNEIYEVLPHFIFNSTFFVWHPLYGYCLFSKEQLDFNLVYIGDL